MKQQLCSLGGCRSCRYLQSERLCATKDLPGVRTSYQLPAVREDAYEYT